MKITVFIAKIFVRSIRKSACRSINRHRHHSPIIFTPPPQAGGKSGQAYRTIVIKGDTPCRLCNSEYHSHGGAHLISVLKSPRSMKENQIWYARNLRSIGRSTVLLFAHQLVV